MRPRPLGSTLLETLVSFALVLLVLLGVIGTVAYGLEGVRSSGDHQEAALLAQELMELSREKQIPTTVFSPPKPGLSETEPVPLNAPPFDDDLAASQKFKRRVVTTPVSTDTANYRSKLYRIEAEVHWQGKRRPHQFRLVGYYRAPN